MLNGFEIMYADGENVEIFRDTLIEKEKTFKMTEFAALSTVNENPDLVLKENTKTYIHPKFHIVQDEKFTLYPGNVQLDIDEVIGWYGDEIVSRKGNQILLRDKLLFECNSEYCAACVYTDKVYVFSNEKPEFRYQFFDLLEEKLSESFYFYGMSPPKLFKVSVNSKCVYITYKLGNSKCVAVYRNGNIKEYLNKDFWNVQRLVDRIRVKEKSKGCVAFVQDEEYLRFYMNYIVSVTRDLKFECPTNPSIYLTMKKECMVYNGIDYDDMRPIGWHGENIVIATRHKIIEMSPDNKIIVVLDNLKNKHSYAWFENNLYRCCVKNMNGMNFFYITKRVQDKFVLIDMFKAKFILECKVGVVEGFAVFGIGYSVATCSRLWNFNLLPGQSN